MKKIIIPIVTLIIGIGTGLIIAEKYTFAKELNAYHESRKALDEIEFSRFEVISLNIEYNQIFNFVAQRAITDGIKEYGLTLDILQLLTPKIMNINKSLKIDCKQYNEDGTPAKIRHEDGTEDFLEILPNDLKIEE